MNMSAIIEDKIGVLGPIGRFDAHSVPETQVILREWNDIGIHEIIIDLTQVNFIDSAALALLVSVMKRCRENGGNLVLCNAQQPVRIILELTRLDRALQIFENAGGAISDLLYGPSKIAGRPQEQ